MESKLRKIFYPVIVEKETGKILPLISAKCDKNWNIAEVEVWRDDDIFFLQKCEFEIITDITIKEVDKYIKNRYEAAFKK